MKIKRLLVFAVIALTVVAFFVSGLGDYLSLELFKSQQAQIGAYVGAHPWQTAAVYFVVYVAVTALSLPGALVMTLVGGALFGLLWGGGVSGMKPGADVSVPGWSRSAGAWSGREPSTCSVCGWCPSFPSS